MLTFHRLEYAAPESLPSPTGLLQQVDSKADMWSVGMILHKLLFFKLPYNHASDNVATEERGGKESADLLEQEVANYSGFVCIILGAPFAVLMIPLNSSDSPSPPHWRLHLNRAASREPIWCFLRAC